MNPILILIGLCALFSWAFSDAKKSSDDTAPLEPTGGNSEPALPEQDTAAEIPVRQPITLEILREIFQDGARPLRRRDAVEILKGAPYFVPKTNAYRALAPSRRFAAHLREDEQGWLHFLG